MKAMLMVQLKPYAEQKIVHKQAAVDQIQGIRNVGRVANGRPQRTGGRTQRCIDNDAFNMY